MKISKKATSIAEAIVVTLIIVVWLTWVYNIFMQSIKLTGSIENKIQAIQIAREWIEWITNIRNTNWILFPSNIDSCWKTLNYDNRCIPAVLYNEIDPTSYKIYRDSDFRWILEEPGWWVGTNYSDPTYRAFYNVWLTASWTYSQTTDITTNLRQIYTRELKVETINAITADWSTNNHWLKITSIVQWKDSSKNDSRKIEIESILTNYKNKN